MEPRYSTIMGVDFGSKKAGTTVAVYKSADSSTLHCLGSRKGQDADTMLINLCGTLKPGLVALDAPLSLPGVYRELEGMRNFHYRHADHELMAMSPMFLGGLTARAISLACRLRHMGWTVIETYPARAFAVFTETELLPKKPEVQDLVGFAERLHQDEGHTEIQAYLGTVDPRGFEWLVDRHHFDAYLAWIAAARHALDKARAYGDKVEGQIWI